MISFKEVNLCDYCPIVKCKVRNTNREKIVLKCDKVEYIKIKSEMNYEQTKLGV